MQELLGRARASSCVDVLQQQSLAIPRTNTWDNSEWRNWRTHVEESLLFAETVVPRTIGVAALVPESSHAAHSGKSGIGSTVGNLVNTCMGSGMLSLPWVLARCGVGGGLGLMLLVPLIANVSIDLLVAAADHTGGRTLTAIAQGTTGRAGGLLCTSVLLLLSFGVLVSYCVVIKQLTPRLARYAFGLPSLPSEALCLGLVCAVCLVPLSSMSTMAQLRFASAASIFLIAGFVVAVVAAALSVEVGSSPVAAEARVYDAHGLKLSSWWRPLDGSPTQWLSTLPIVLFSYLCHHNIPFMYSELADASLPPKAAPCLGAASTPGSGYADSCRGSFRTATRLALLAATAIYLATAAGGFVAFGAATAPNLLVNLQPGPADPLPDTLVPTLHSAFVGMMITTFPTVSFGLRTACHTLCFPNTPTATTAHRWTEAAALVFASHLCAVAADDLCFVFQIVGSTCGSMLMFILPAAMFLCGPAAVRYGNVVQVDGALGFHLAAPEDATPAMVSCAWAVLGFGIFVTVACTAASVGLQ